MRDAVQIAAAGDRLFEDLLESAPDAMVFVDRDGCIVLVNGQIERLFGYRRDELIGQPVETLIPARFESAHRRHRKGFINEPSTRPMGAGLDLYGRRADGSEFPVDVSLGAAGEGEGQLIIAAIRDVTEAKRAANEMRRLATAAERANEAKSEFLSRMSHELRTPLNAIIGFGQVLHMEEPEDSPRREGIGQILNAGRHLLSLINEMLDMARIESGRIDLSLEPVRIGAVVEQALELVGPQAAARHVPVNVHLEGAQPLVVRADQQRLVQVLLNLLGNAVKYTGPSGSVHVSAERRTEWVAIHVRDTGPGIPAGELERIFEPFERLAQVAEESEGTGLGLAVTKRLVEAMGGTIGVESEPGVGSTFTVELPQGLVEPFALVTSPRWEPEPVGTRSVLYIEDNLVSQRVVERILEPLGVEVRIAVEGALGIELARRRRPDVILLDLHLPDMRGEDVLRRLKDDPATREIPVAVLSAATATAVERRLLSAGADAFIAKPFDARVLLATVDELTGRRGSEER